MRHVYRLSTRVQNTPSLFALVSTILYKFTWFCGVGNKCKHEWADKTHIATVLVGSVAGKSQTCNATQEPAGVIAAKCSWCMWVTNGDVGNFHVPL